MEQEILNVPACDPASYFSRMFYLTSSEVFHFLLLLYMEEKSFHLENYPLDSCRGSLGLQPKLTIPKRTVADFLSLSLTCALRASLFLEHRI
jgi:hypothetical protein